MKWGAGRALLPLVFMSLLGVAVFLGGLRMNLVLLLGLVVLLLLLRPRGVPGAARVMLVLVVFYAITAVLAQLVAGAFSPLQVVLGSVRLANLSLVGLLVYEYTDIVALARALCRLSPRAALYYLASLRMLVLARRALGEAWGIARVNALSGPRGLRGRLTVLQAVARSLAHALLEEALQASEAQYLRGPLICGRGIEITRRSKEHGVEAPRS